MISITKIKQTIDISLVLALRSIKVQIREHVLGYAWALIIPILYAICYIFIKQELMGNTGIQTENTAWEALRAFSGITMLQFWMQLVQSMSELVRKQKGMLRGLNISPTPFVLAVVLEGFINLFIRASLIVLALPLLGLDFPHEVNVWLIFLSSLILILFTAATIGLLLLPWSALYADVRKALSSITLPLLLISPVFYPAVKSSESWLYWLNCINPIASPLAIISGVLKGDDYFLYIPPFLIWMVISFCLFTWSISQLKNQIPILLERIGN